MLCSVKLTGVSAEIPASSRDTRCSMTGTLWASLRKAHTSPSGVSSKLTSIVFDKNVGNSSSSFRKGDVLNLSACGFAAGGICWACNASGAARRCCGANSPSQQTIPTATADATSVEPTTTFLTGDRETRVKSKARPVTSPNSSMAALIAASRDIPLLIKSESRCSR